MITVRGGIVAPARCRQSRGRPALATPRKTKSSGRNPSRSSVLSVSSVVSRFSSVPLLLFDFLHRSHRCRASRLPPRPVQEYSSDWDSEEVCPSHKTVLEAAPNPFSALFNSHNSLSRNILHISPLFIIFCRDVSGKLINSKRPGEGVTPPINNKVNSHRKVEVEGKTDDTAAFSET